jgi:hypothetical protein
MHGRILLAVLCGLTVSLLRPGGAKAACCYFSAQNADILQPAQKVFLTWDPSRKVETFTVQPKFEGNALDFGMVIPTPSQPRLHEMPRDFFKHLAVWSILKKREYPASQLWPDEEEEEEQQGRPAVKATKASVVILEQGVVGSLEYKIIEASRADDLFRWLKDNKYHYAGDEATLNFYVKKKWLFTVMKIDTMQMKKNKDGTYTGEVTPTRFAFASDQLVYPLKITQISVKDKTEALFYVQAPHKVDLKGDMSWQYTWIPMLQAAQGCTAGGLPGRGDEWLTRIDKQIPALLQRGLELGFTFQAGKRPEPNRKGRIPTTMEWAHRLDDSDIAMLKGAAPYSDKLPDVDDGFGAADLKDPKRARAIYKVIQARLAKAEKERPQGYLVRHAPEEDIRALRELLGHLQAGMFITKFRKVFTREEMNDDLVLVPARVGQEDDVSEYQEILPTSPP